MLPLFASLAVLLTFTPSFQPVEGCIHDTLDHKLSDGHQQYNDDHPFLLGNRRRQLDTDDTTTFQTYSQAVDEVFQPIRITAYYDNSTLDFIPAEKRALIFQIIPDAINRFKNALQVVPVQGKLAAQHSCKTQWLTTPPVCKTFVQNEKCLDMPIPDGHFGATRSCSTCTSLGCATGRCSTTAAGGVADTDFLIYVRSATTGYCGTRTLAYASSCQKDQFDRPTFGMVNFCSAQLNTAPEAYEAQVATAMHELTHALGFSAQLFPLMRFPDGSPRTPRDANGHPPTYTAGQCPNGQAIDYYVAPSENTVKYFNERDHVVAKMVTPKVAAFVQSHFNCTSVAGAELESQDNSGCLGSHWEERLFEPEYMTPVESFRNVFSALTLAFFEDSGWYRANASTAQRLYFGEQRGCAFASEKCIDPDTAKPVASDHYCTSNSVESCSVDGTSRSMCTISSGRTIPPEYQYFPGFPTKGGEDFADFCPMNVGYSYGDCSDPSNLMLPGKTTINILGESYCPTCKCTATSLRSADSTNWSVNARRQTGCYAMRCLSNGSNDTSSNTIELTIPRSKTNDVVAINCTRKGEKLTVQGFSGYITCPDPFTICNSDQVYSFGDSSNGHTVAPGSGTAASGSGTANLRSSNSASGLRSDVVVGLSIVLHFVWLVVRTSHR
ncbi:hypothetical protein BBJ28_00011344 [Nothophytophthora sp. Chile5]|nr:hypothetical protein BBJ28_00011344 [Nothophytophthora sp. Chile5]